MKIICKIRVFLLGYDRGHAWRPVLESTQAASVCQVCIRCTENGWLIR